jgi:hypothetical protein
MTRSGTHPRMQRLGLLARRFGFDVPGGAHASYSAAAFCMGRWPSISSVVRLGQTADILMLKDCSDCVNHHRRRRDRERDRGSDAGP